MSKHNLTHMSWQQLETMKNQEMCMRHNVFSGNIPSRKTTPLNVNFVLLLFRSGICSKNIFEVEFKSREREWIVLTAGAGSRKGQNSNITVRCNHQLCSKLVSSSRSRHYFAGQENVTHAITLPIIWDQYAADHSRQRDSKCLSSLSSWVDCAIESHWYEKKKDKIKQS